MKNEQFNELLASVQEMDDIVQGKKAAPRVTEFPDPEVKLIREKVGLSQHRFARLIGIGFHPHQTKNRYPMKKPVSFSDLLERRAFVSFQTETG